MLDFPREAFFDDTRISTLQRGEYVKLDCLKLPRFVKEKENPNDTKSIGITMLKFQLK